MIYTILNAHYANEDRTAAVALTQEAALVVLSAADTPEEWAALMAWGEPSAYVPPPPPPEPTKAEILAQIAALTAKVATLP
jgi:hypothetical protein